MPVPDTLLRRLAASLNDFVALDPEFPPRLDTLEGKTLRVHVEGLSAGVDVRIRGRRFELAHAGGEAPDVTVSGPPLALLGLLKADEPMERLQGGGIHVQGEMRVAQRFSTLFGELDIDWEEWLAARIGDAPAHQAGEWVRGFLSWRRRTHAAWRNTLSEYLQEEARHLPTRIEIENFLDDVDTVRDRAERAEARLAILEKRLKNQPD
jgi:ubiquinone biosynthesis protein UbiJ